jgi:two-component system, chemotaxis family, protein-glutamate methylesterase/glutaminase
LAATTGDDSETKEKERARRPAGTQIAAERPAMARKDIVVIGASAGGLEAVLSLVGCVPQDLPASLFLVLHQSPGWKSALPQLLAKAGPLRAGHPADGEPIEPGRIYVAPNDHHMLLEAGCVRITRGPRENRFRPAVDPLFRSAAYIYGPRTVGVVLSGALDDGTSGLYTVKLRGGTAIVQEPSDATVSAMPLNALQHTEADYILPAADIGELLERVVREPAPQARRVPPGEDEKTLHEIRIAQGRTEAGQDFTRFGTLTPFTCPECRGVLTRVNEGRIARFRCHTGHALSRETLLSAIARNVEDSLYDAVRALDEAAMLLEDLAADFAREGHGEAAARSLALARVTRERSRPVRDAATGSEALDPDSLEARPGQ